MNLNNLFNMNQKNRNWYKSGFMDEESERLKYDNRIRSSGWHNETTENIKVIVRVRPPLLTEIDESQTIIIHDEKTLSVVNFDQSKQFECRYDAIITPSNSQLDVYNLVRECTLSVIEGVNSTIFAYGQTGSGKTFSMYGPPSEIENSNSRTNIFASKDDANLLSFKVYCSFVQIYNESLYDMLRDATMSNPLAIREDVQGREIYVQGLSEYEVKNINDMMSLLRKSEEHRAIRETHMNLHSSRSHSLFQIIIEQSRYVDGREVTLRSKYNLVDLAGSEKWNANSNLKDDHINEMTNINLSLHTLGRCIAALASRERQPVNRKNDIHIPYRDSKLTRLLQDSLGGNSKTVLIATVSPSRSNVNESISTLKFADRAKQVMVQTKVNEIVSIDQELVLRLQREVDCLKDLLRRYVDPVILQSVMSSIEMSSSAMKLSTTNTPERTHSSSKLITSIDDLRASKLQSPPLDASFDDASTRHVGAGKTLGKSCRQSSTLYDPSAHLFTGHSSVVQNSSGIANDEHTAALPPSHWHNRLLDSEREKSNRLLAENESLHQDLECLREKMKQYDDLSCDDALRKKSDRDNDSTNIGESRIDELIATIKEAWDGQTIRFWNRFDQIERVMNQFFRFEIEEDDMKAKVNSLLKSTKSLRQELIVPELMLKRIIKNFEKQCSNELGAQCGFERYKTSNSSDELQKNNDSPMQPEAAHAFKRTDRINYSVKKFTGRLASLPQQIASTLPSLQIHSTTTEKAAKLSSELLKKSISLESIASATCDQVVKDASSARSEFNQTKDKTDESFFRGSSINVENLNCRVRGANNSTQVVSNELVFESSTNIQAQSSLSETADEEPKLQRELKKVEKRLQHQMRQRDILKFRYDKQIADKDAEEDERKSILEAERLREVKRLQRAEKLKKQLREYDARIKAEAEQIEACKRLGIDVTSLVS